MHVRPTPQPITRRGQIAFALLTIGLLAAACGSTDLPESLQAGDTSTTTVATDAAPSSTLATTTVAPDSSGPTTTIIEIPPVPEPAFDAIDSSGTGIACVGSRSDLSCLFDGEWSSFDRNNSPIFDWVQEIAICDDDSILVPSINGIASYQGGVWSEIDMDFASGKPNAVACADGVIWAGGSGYAARYDGTTWTSWDSEATLGVSDFVRSVDDIAIAPDGSAWVVTGTSVARWAADVWTVWEEGNGFEERYFMDAVAVDAADDGSYTVHVLTSRGFLRFEGDAWVIDDARVNGDDRIAVADGEVWVPAFRQGVTRFQGASSTDIGVEAGLSSPTVRGIAIDDDGNPWFATSYGLTVFTDDGPRTYRADNSDLFDNQAYSVAVRGTVPVLPADAPEEWATVTGSVIDESGAPMVDVIVELCVSEQPDDFESDTPCAEEPYQSATVSDDDGEFRIGGLRPGRYTISMMGPTGWTKFVDGSTAIRFEAPGGTTTDLGEFSILPIVAEEEPAEDVEPPAE